MCNDLKMAKICSKSSCGKPIQGNHHGIKCERCDKTFHKKCSGLTDILWKQFQSGEMLFNCPSCKARRRSSVIQPSVVSPKSTPRQADTVNGSLIEDENNSGAASSANVFKSTVDAIHNTIKDMEKSLCDLSDSVSDIETTIRRLESRIKEIDDIKEENVRLRNKISVIERRLGALEENGPKRNVPIRNVARKVLHKITLGGIEVASGENVKQLCSKVFGKLGVSIDVENDIGECSRLKSKNAGTIPAIVVELSSRQDLELLLKAASQVDVHNTDLDLNVDRKIFINEKLSSSCYNLLREAKKLRDHGFKFVWARNDRVLVRKVEGDRVLQMRDTEDIKKLLNN